MSKILIVVDGKDQAVSAIAQMMEAGPRTSKDSVVILNVTPPTQPWQKSNTPKKLRETELEKQRAYLRNAMRPWLSSVGIEFETRNCFGDVAKTVTHLVEAEGCDEIVIAEPKAGRWAKILERLTGVRTPSYVDRILPAASVPVIVVKDNAIERHHARANAGSANPRRPSSRSSMRTPSVSA